MTLEQQIDHFGDTALRIKAERDELVSAGRPLLELLDDYMSVSSMTKNEAYADALEAFRAALAKAGT